MHRHLHKMRRSSLMITIEIVTCWRGDLAPWPGAVDVSSCRHFSVAIAPAAVPFPPLSRVGWQACTALLSRADADGGGQAAVDALNRLCDLLERAERQYQALIGDPHINPGQRSQYPTGQMLYQVGREEAARGRIHERWTFNGEVIRCLAGRADADQHMHQKRCLGLYHECSLDAVGEPCN